MPSKSKAQQRFMAQAYQVRKWMDTNGKEGTNPKDIDKEYREDIERIAKDMKKGDLKKYAETKHKNLPDRVEENVTVDNTNGMGETSMPSEDGPGSGDIAHQIPAGGTSRFLTFAEFQNSLKV